MDVCLRAFWKGKAYVKKLNEEGNQLDILRLGQFGIYDGRYINDHESLLLSAAGAALEGKVADPAVTANAYWGFANSAATMVLVVLSPILGTMADYKGKKKKMFQFFLFTGVGFTALLAFVPSRHWLLLLIVYVITAIGFAGSNIFYDAFLIDVSEDKNMDRVSSLGFALGYIGSTIPFILCMVLVVLATLGIIPVSLEMSYKISFIVTALWWIGFSIPIIRDVHQVYGMDPEAHYVRKSFQRLGRTLKEIRKHRHIFIFLLAYFFYIDGVDTIIKMATAYGSTIGIGSIMLLVILLVTQFVAFPFAILYGKLAEKIGTKRTLNLGILTYCVICIVAFFMSPERDTKTLTIMFWILAMLVGTAQGGIQALSRSYFGKIVPKNQANEFLVFTIFSGSLLPFSVLYYLGGFHWPPERQIMAWEVLLFSLFSGALFSTLYPMTEKCKKSFPC